MSPASLAAWTDSVESRLRLLGNRAGKDHGADYVGTELEFVGARADALQGFALELQRSLPFDWETAANLLWQKPLFEARMLAILLAARHARNFSKSHWKLFSLWLKESSGWAMVDTLCGKVLAPLVESHPDLAAKTDPWTHSKNLWLRRSSLVVFCTPLREGMFEEIALDHAAILVADREPMIVKAESWTLRSAVKRFRNRVEQFLSDHESELATQVLREVRTKLTTGRKTRKTT